MFVKFRLGNAENGIELLAEVRLGQWALDTYSHIPELEAQLTGSS